jgi:hypothetical protein
MRYCLGVVLGKKAFGSPEARHYAEDAYGLVFDALWQTGAHPSVFAEPSKNKVQLKRDGDEWTMVWRRPKTRRVCVMPVTRGLAAGLLEYLNNRLGDWPIYTTRSLLRTMRECAEEAGLKDVTPKTIRHTVAYNLFKAHGPSVAKESLGVSDKVLQDYMAMNAETRVRVIREGRKGVPEVDPPMTQSLREKGGAA